MVTKHIIHHKKKTYLQTHKTLYGFVHYVEKKPFITGVSLKHVIRRSIDYNYLHNWE